MDSTSISSYQIGNVCLFKWRHSVITFAHFAGPLKQFMWILWFIILAETLNEETCGIITCMILHAKCVICLLCPKTNKNKRFLATFELSKGFAFLQMHRMWMWILCFIILREKMNEETYHIIVQSNSTILLLSNPEFSSNLTSLETQFMWILWFIILTEKINEETYGVITCMYVWVWMQSMWLVFNNSLP